MWISDQSASCCKRWRPLLAAAALVLAAGCAPKDIATSTRESTMLAIGDPWSCTVKADLVGRSSSIAFSTESRNQVAQVKIELRVTKGTLRVGYYDMTGERQVLVTPSEPASVEMKTKMHPERRSF